MGLQTKPRIFDKLKGLQLTDAQAIYTHTPKRALFDALYRALSDKGGNPYDVSGEMLALIRLCRKD